MIPHSNQNREFDGLLDESRGDSRVVALALTGSRGKSRSTENSDWDAALICRDEAAGAARTHYAAKYPSIDLRTHSFSEFRTLAAWGSETAWDRYDWARLTPCFDKTSGEVTRLMQEKGRIPGEAVSSFVSGALDGYINQVYRCLKCLRDGDELASLLEAASSIPLFLDAAFALSGARLRPYAKYLKWELDIEPLSAISLRSSDLLEAISAVIRTGGVRPQKMLFFELERAARNQGFGATFDSWPELGWMKEKLSQA